MAPRPTKKSPGSTTPQPPPRPDLPVQARHPPPPGLPATAPRPTAVVGRVAELMGGKGGRPEQGMTGWVFYRLGIKDGLGFAAGGNRCREFWQKHRCDGDHPPR